MGEARHLPSASASLGDPCPLLRPSRDWGGRATPELRAPQDLLAGTAAAEGPPPVPLRLARRPRERLYSVPLQAAAGTPGPQDHLPSSCQE